MLKLRSNNSSFIYEKTFCPGLWYLHCWTVVCSMAGELRKCRSMARAPVLCHSRPANSWSESVTWIGASGKSPAIGSTPYSEPKSDRATRHTEGQQADEIQRKQAALLFAFFFS